MADEDREVRLLREMREAHRAYAELTPNRTGLLSDDSPTPMTDEQLAAMQRVMVAEQAYRDFRRGG